MDGQRRDLTLAVEQLDTHWEILTTGITVKLYPSCAATHPTLDVLLDLRYGEGITPGDIDAIEVLVDSMTPRLLIYDRPATGLEGKFSMPFCASAAIADGHVGISTFEVSRIQSADVQALMPKVTMRADPAFDSTPPLSHAAVKVRLRDGRQLERAASGARGYPARPASETQLAEKFTECAQRVLPPAGAEEAWSVLGALASLESLAVLTELLMVHESPVEARV
jgi:2-methylcitrate dehydratase PrpD